MKHLTLVAAVVALSAGCAVVPGTYGRFGAKSMAWSAIGT